MIDDPTTQQPKASSFETLFTLFHRWRTGTLGEILDDWRWIFTYSRRYKGVILYYVILGIISSTLGLVSSIAGKYLIDIITGYQVTKLWIMVVVMVGSSLFGLVIGNVLGRVTLKLQIRINNDIQGDIFDQIISADWMAINRYSNGDVLNRFTGDVGTVSANAISWLPTIIISFYQFFATLGVIMHYNTVMALLAFASAPFTLLASKFIIKKQREYNMKMRKMSSEVMAFEVETFYNMDTLKSFGILDQYSRKLREWQQKFKAITLDYNWFSIKTNVYMSLVAMLVQFTAFGYCLYLLWSHEITYGTMTLFLQQRSVLAGAFSSVIGIIPAFLNSSVSAHRVRELVQLPKEKHVEGSSWLNQYVDDGFELRMREVDFGYVKENRVITNSNLVARPGEIVGIVGPSGEGKTTIIRMFLGLIKPDCGEAIIKSSDGTEVELNIETRHLFAYVPQGNTILAGTIAENMRMGREEATDAEIEEALRVACAWDFVSKLPDGINTYLGERGRGLSEGQAQRIAIARAVLRNAPVLLLDEATSALDVSTERMVLKNIVSKHPNKTCIVTTHRPTVLNLCQRVYRVMSTRVTELSEEESSRMAMEF